MPALLTNPAKPMLLSLLAPLAGVFFTFCFAPWPLGALAVVPLTVLFALW